MHFACSLIAIGESLNILINSPKIHLKNYPRDWLKSCQRDERDIITHHYFDLDAEAVYDVCQNDIKPLLNAINRIITDVEKEYSL